MSEKGKGALENSKALFPFLANSKGVNIMQNQKIVSAILTGVSIAGVAVTSIY